MLAQINWQNILNIVDINKWHKIRIPFAYIVVGQTAIYDQTDLG